MYHFKVNRLYTRPPEQDWKDTLFSTFAGDSKVGRNLLITDVPLSGTEQTLLWIGETIEITSIKVFFAKKAFNKMLGSQA